MIGIGILTYQRPRHLEHCIRMVKEHTPEGTYQLEIADDTTDRRGVAFRTNELLRKLKDCEYIFLFNDDCFPIKDGWERFYIDAGTRTDNHHLLYLKPTPNIRPLGTVDGITYYDNCGGVLMFLTKHAVEKVGGMHPDYGWYGYEHAGYSWRIHKAGLTKEKYGCPVGAYEYIYAMDYDHYLPVNKLLGHKSSMNIDEIGKSVKQNQEVFKKDIETIYQPL